MQFLYPSFLWALGLIAIPILIHLFNLRRYKRVQFTNVKHLKEIQQQTKRNKNIRQLLILLSRIFAVAALVLLFAQPYIPKDQQKLKDGQSLVTIYVDNSFSMLGESSAGPLLEVAKSKTNEILKAYPETDRFQIISNEFKPSSSRFLSRLDAQALVDEIQVTSSSKSLSQLIQKIEETDGLNSFANRMVYLLSDFQNSDPKKQEFDTSASYIAIPLHSERQSNLSVDSLWFTSPFIKKNEALNLKVRVRNEGDNDLESIGLKLMIDGVQKLVKAIDLKAGSSQEVELSFTVDQGGWRSGQIQIEDHPIQFDNTLHFTFNVRERVEILEIFASEPSSNLRSLYASDAYFKHTSVSKNSLDYSAIPQNDLVILNGLNAISTGLNKVLLDYITAGGSVAVLPGETNPNSLLDQNSVPIYTLGQLNTQASDVIKMDIRHPLFDKIFETVPDNVDLPKVLKSYPIKSNNATYSSILRMANQEDLLAQVNLGTGRIFVLAGPLDKTWSNFHEHALFVPLFLKMSFAGASQLPHYYEVGSHKLLQLDHNGGEDGAFQIVKEAMELTAELIVNDNRTYLNEGGEISEDGIYDVKANDSAIQKLAFNFSRAESTLPEWTSEELNTMLEGKGVQVLEEGSGSVAQFVKKAKSGEQLWQWFALLSLFFLAIEILLLRFWPKG